MKKEFKRVVPRSFGVRRKLWSPFKADAVKGKVALISGGGSGIGFEISTQFGKHGASIAIMGRRKKVLDSAVAALESLGIVTVGFEGDVCKQEDAKRVVESTFQHFGRLDILVNATAGNFLLDSKQHCDVHLVEKRKAYYSNQPWTNQNKSRSSNSKSNNSQWWVL